VGVPSTRRVMRLVCVVAAVSAVASVTSSSAWGAKPETMFVEATCTVDGVVGVRYGSFSWDGPDPAAWRLDGTSFEITRDHRKGNRVDWGDAGGPVTTTLLLENRKGEVLDTVTLTCDVIAPT
jgi:hypothetical protein